MKPIITPTSITIKEISLREAEKLMLKLCSDNNIPLRWYMTSLKEDLPKTISVYGDVKNRIKARDYSLTITAADDMLKFTLNNRTLKN